MKRKKGRKCQPQDWATVHYKTITGDYGRPVNHVLEDSRKFKKGQPAVFQIGMYKSLKCWEIAASYMKAGQMLKLECPSYLAYGGNAKYGHFGHDLIPANSDLIFELEVLECESSVEKINAANRKAGNNAPVVRYFSDKEDEIFEEKEKPKVTKKAITDVKKKVNDLRKNVIKQKKKINDEKLKEKDVEH